MLINLKRYFQVDTYSITKKYFKTNMKTAKYTLKQCTDNSQSLFVSLYSIFFHNDAMLRPYIKIHMTSYILLLTRSMVLE